MVICIGKKRIETWICSSENFRKPGEQKVGFDLLYDLEKRDDESPLEFAVRCGWEQYIYQMFLVDYLVANRDRHGGNLEVLRQGDKEMRLAPLFDQGVSLLFSTYGEEKPSKFDLKIEELLETDREYILNGLDEILSRNHLTKIWQMIWKRWCRYEEICGKGRTLWE